MAADRDSVLVIDGREIASAEPSRWCALNDCQRATWLLRVGETRAANEALALALNMMRVARRLEELRGETTEVS
jgi:hypothetical protein